MNSPRACLKTTRNIFEVLGSAPQPTRAIAQAWHAVGSANRKITRKRQGPSLSSLQTLAPIAPPRRTRSRRSAAFWGMTFFACSTPRHAISIPDLTPSFRGDSA